MAIKVIFLDIDGVMNSYATQPPIEKGALFSIHAPLVERLNGILEFTGAKLVLSSTWRQDPDWREVMLAAGIADVFLGRTPIFPGQKRGIEIQDWIDMNPYGVEKYCILDDDSDMLPHQKHFKTSLFEGGLTAEIAAQVCEYLGPAVL